MSTLDSDIGFDAVLRRAAAAARFDLDASRGLPPIPERRGVTAFSVFAGLGIISAIIFATGYSALLSETPAVWIHRLMALTVAQSIIIAGVAMKLLPLVKPESFSVRIVSKFKAPDLALLTNARSTQQRAPAVPPPLPQPPKPVIGGTLAGREFLQYEDGSIEIDTLVGRRRFVSLDAAKEFVGG